MEQHRSLLKCSLQSIVQKTSTAHKITNENMFHFTSRSQVITTLLLHGTNTQHLNAATKNDNECTSTTKKVQTNICIKYWYLKQVCSMPPYASR